MSAQLEQVKALAAKAQAANAWELKPVIVALVVAIIEWMTQQEEVKNGSENTESD